MAIYYLDLSKGTKGKKDKKGKGIYRGKSALAKYNYIIRDENYIKGKEEILATEYGYLPNFAKDNPAFFWEATDKFEAKNGVVFRQLIFALPRELNAEQQQELCRNFAEVVCGKYKLPYTYAIHKGEFDHRGNRNTEETNPHCHLIFSERANDETEQKKRTAENYFQRNGGAKKIRELQAKNWLLEHRKLWADLANQALEKAGYSERIDHRSLLEQGITDRNPQKKRYWRDDQNIAPYYLTDLEKELKQQLSKNKKLQKEIKASIKQEKIENLDEIYFKTYADIANKFTLLYEKYNKTISNEELNSIKEDLATKFAYGKEVVNEIKEMVLLDYDKTYSTIEQDFIKERKEAKAKAEAEAKKKAETQAIFDEFYKRINGNSDEIEKNKKEEAPKPKQADKKDNIKPIQDDEARRKAEEAKARAEESLNLAKNNSYQQIYQTLIDFGLDIEANKNWLEDVKNNISMKENEKDVEKQTKQYIDLVKEEVQKVQKAAFAEFEAQITKGWEEEDYIPRPIGEMPISAIENYNYNDENFNNYEEIEEQQNEEISEDLLTQFNDLINNILQNQNQLNQNNLLIQNSSNISNQTEILENQPQQQEKKLLPNLSSYSLEEVGRKMFEALGGDDDKYKKPDLTNLPKVIKEAKEQGFSIDENALYTMQKEINKGKKYTVLGIAEIFEKSVLQKFNTYSKKQQIQHKKEYDYER